MKNQTNEGSAIKKILKRIFYGLILIILIAVIAKVYQVTNPVTIVKNVEVKVDTSAAMLAEKIDSLEKAVVESVRKCEQGKYVESDGLVTYDPQQGGSSMEKIPSFGTLQFKKTTVIYYYKSLYNKVITGKEAILIALDDELSGQLAQDIMFKSKNMANDWLNCSNKLSLDAQISAIKKIK